MNDSELITAVKESVTGVHMHVSTEQIVSRSRTIRARRRIPGVAGALAVAAGVAVAVAALLPASHQPSGQPTAQLAAWTVVRQADGTVSVTIRELRNPAGLQRRLRADGVPASVTFFGQPAPRSCQGYPADTALINKVFTVPHAGRFPVMIIHPSALPGDAGVQINPPVQQHNIRVAIGLVHASPQCTGS